MKRKTKKKLFRVVFYTVCLAVFALLIAGVSALIGLLTDGAESPSTTTATTVTTTTVSTATATTATTQPQNPAQADGWELTLVNPWNTIPDGYEVELTTLSNGQKVDSRAYPALQQMMDAMRAEGLSPIICSSYRTQQKQETLFQNKINRLMNQGMSAEEARVEAGRVVAVPGTSEHQLGLAVDIVDKSYQGLDEKQEQTATQQWLMKNSYKYGYILRYPNDKSAITGIIYEPWHYRYVGVSAATEMYNAGLCLEEYLEQ